MDTTNPLADAALAYLARGFQPTPIVAGEKRPFLTAWTKDLVPPDQYPVAFAPGMNVGIMLGAVSGGLVDVDLDDPIARELADEYLPHTDAVTGRPSSPRSHRWYIAPGVTFRRHQMPAPNRTVIVEIRSDGGQTLVGPSVHPSGERYDDLTGTPATVPAAMLTACVEGLARAVAARRGVVDAPKAPTPARVAAVSVDDAHTERRAIAYLDSLPAAISGAGGHSATFAAASALVHGFGLSESVALEMLQVRYNPRCDPPWTDRELEHKVRQAGKVAHDRPFRYLADAERIDAGPAVDLSGFDWRASDDDEPSAAVETIIDPGPIPGHLLNVPGLIGDLIDHNLDTAMRPQPALALGAAICLVATITGRKVRDHRNGRTNIYAVGVAPSGSGKDHARKINAQTLHLAGMGQLTGPEELASDSGLVSALELSPATLFQIDEFGRFLKAIGSSKGAPHLEGIVSTFMKLHSSASVVWKGKAYADPSRNKVINQPHAVLWGTTVPSNFFAAMTKEQVSDGFVARMLLFEGTRVAKRTDVEWKPIPDRVVEQVRRWGEFKPGGDLASVNPDPLVVKTDREAAKTLSVFGVECDAVAPRDDDGAMAVWARAEESAARLALVYACSRDGPDPTIDADAARWACDLVRHLTRRVLFLADSHVAENDFEGHQLRVIRFLRAETEAGRPWVKKAKMTQRLRSLKPADRDAVVRTLIDRGEIVERPTASKTRPGVEWALQTGQ